MLFAFLLALVLSAQAKKPAAPPPPAATAAPAAPALDPAYEADIRKLLEVTGSAAIAEQVFDQMIIQLKPLAPEVPEEFWIDFRASAKSSELIDMLVPIYAKYFTHDDIKALLAFYDTPTGKKFVSSQPALVQDSMDAGAAWGERVAADVVARIEARNKQ